MTASKSKGILATNPAANAGGTGHSSPDIFTALWRYRWAVVLPAIVSALIGFLVYVRTPETYQSSSRLLIESSQPVMLDQVTGTVVGGVPQIEIIQSQLFSDRVLSLAFNDPLMQMFHEEFHNDPQEFIALSHKSLSLTAGTDTPQARSRVVILRFEHQDGELAESAVKSFSKALQQLFDERQKSSRSELIRLITEATEEVGPKLDEAEKAYSEFRRRADLVWNSDGDAVNPHRERQLYLIGRRSELIEEIAQREQEHKKISKINENSKDHAVAIGVIGQLLDIDISLPSVSEARENLRESDAKLADLELQQQLVPMMVERNKYVAQFGGEHPTVKQLDADLNLMKSELKRIVLEQTDRLVELMNENKPEQIEPAAIAQEAIKTVLYAIEAEIELLSEKKGEVENQIEVEKGAAIALAGVEQENQDKLREIAHHRDLLNQLKEQMARVNLTEEEGGTRVLELTAPSGAYRVGPMLAKYLAIGTFLGLGLGIGLAFLLEKNANTFREQDEISEFLGVPVLAHLPFFKGRLRKVKKGEIDPFSKLDPYLSVVHQPASVAAEAIRSVRTSVMFGLGGDEGGKVIQVTSPLPGDGKSTIAGNLACSLAQSGKRVLAIDCDLRRPQLTDNFSLGDDNGLTNVLNGECEPHEACHQSPITSLHVMPSGPIPTNPAEALTLPEMSDLLSMLREKYDYVLLDTPPLLVVTDPSITASLVDGVVVVLRIRRKSKPNAKESTNILRAVGARILGVVINNSDETSASDGYRGYGYYRYGRYTSRYYRSSGNGKQGGSNSQPVVVSGRGLAKLSRVEDAEQPSYADSNS